SVAAALAAALALAGLPRGLGPRGPETGGPLDLTLAEQREVIEALREHGFRAQDLERRVHGLAWNRWNGGQGYLGQWLLGTNGDEPADHALRVERCEPLPAGFSAWSKDVATSRAVKRAIVGYRAELSPPQLSFDVADDQARSYASSFVPFYGQILH